MTQSFRSDLALLALSAVAVLADLACVLTGNAPPSLFSDVAIAGLTGAAGVSLPFSRNPSPAAADAESSATYQAPAAVDPPQGAGQ